MAEASHDMFSLTPFDFTIEVQGDHNPPFENYEKENVALKGKQDLFFEDLARQVENSTSCSGYGVLNQESGATEEPSQFIQQLGESFEFFPQPQPTQKTTNFLTSQTESDHQEPGNEITPPPSYSLLNLELLRNYLSGVKKLKGKQSGNTSNNEHHGKKISTEEIMRIAGARYIQFSDQMFDDYSMLMHPFGHALSGLSEEETRDVELTHLLLNAAEKVGSQQFERASSLLSRCEWIASQQGNSVQRIVHHFSVALRERIDRETGIFPKNSYLVQENISSNDGMGYELSMLKHHQELPFSQVMQFTTVQSLIENVGSAKRIHLIDLAIRSGVHWTAFMQALGERQQNPVQLLRITAIGSKEKSHLIEDVGQRLSSFAKSMDLPFSFKAVYVLDMNDIRQDMFEIRHDEALAIHSKLFLRTLLSRPICLENLMRVIKNLNPFIMVIQEVEANHNSPSFVNRFIEVLFFYSAYFDAFETCMDSGDEHRIRNEEILCSGIRNIVAMEGSERHARNVKLEVWRTFFARFKMVEVGFSESSLYQASLVAKQFPCGRSVNLHNNGKGLIVGWKGTPLHSVTAWKFGRERWRSFSKNNNSQNPK
ncbi:putative DELLA protein RGL2 [Tripterygium wilfordii]|uniref:Putative DELLA protein RGL2 n=1 Tax=Tripterygium wilfordii TaxID=458696 RepID=A0A7J7D5D5_TRIWF|nr:DELLA protein RGL1-like [Tripterygium wilfordii]KAF5741521.1 putative DELLA protein RGL2 [Tripterygium wilfordii]